MYRKSSRFSLIRDLFILFTHQFSIVIDQTFESIYIYLETPLQNACHHFGIPSFFKSRQGWTWETLGSLTDLLTQSYFFTFVFYFVVLFFAPLYSHAVQQSYFVDPLLSINRQCIDIQFVRINSIDRPSRLKENFLGENRIFGEESQRHDLYDYTQVYQLFDLLNNHHWMICQRSLYLYARFQTYSSLLHSQHSHYRFRLSKSSRTFSIDQPPFLDLCLNTLNRTHSDRIQSELRSLSSYVYSSINLFLFDFNFTQVTVTLYELNHQSTHLERISIHTGWLRDLYVQFDFFKYQDALSTVLFDGYALGQQYVDIFNYSHVPVPADTVLGLNEMVEQAILVLPLCPIV